MTEPPSPPRVPSIQPVGPDIAAVDRALLKARATIHPRAAPADLDRLVLEGVLVVDIRPVELRSRDGEVDGAIIVDRNVLEWRLDPTSPHRLEGHDDPNRPIVLVCDEGYASSLAAAQLVELGLPHATDLIGGYQAWRNERDARD